MGSLYENDHNLKHTTLSDLYLVCGGKCQACVPTRLTDWPSVNGGWPSTRVASSFTHDVKVLCPEEETVLSIVRLLNKLFFSLARGQPGGS